MQRYSALRVQHHTPAHASHAPARAHTPQSFAAGVGNWVADEVLFQSRLHPEQLLAELGEPHIAALHEALGQVVRTAAEVDADSSRFPADWMFHVRWGKQAGMLGGHRIDHVTVGARTSCFVPALQKLVHRGGSSGKGSGGSCQEVQAKAAKRPKSGVPVAVKAETAEQLHQASGHRQPERHSSKAARPAQTAAPLAAKDEGQAAAAGVVQPRHKRVRTVAAAAAAAAGPSRSLKATRARQRPSATRQGIADVNAAALIDAQAPPAGADAGHPAAAAQRRRRSAMTR